MKRLVLLSGLSFLLCSASQMWMAAPVGAQSAPADVSLKAHGLAPADAYFGRFRISVLGMRNAIRDISKAIDIASSEDLSSLYHKLTMVEDAILDLKSRYPEDSWVPQFGLSLAQTFARMPFASAQNRANDALGWLIAEYPNTDQAFYAGRMRRTLWRPIEAMDVPAEPRLPSYAVPERP